MKVSVCIPSYKRPIVETLRYIPFARVYVCETEYEDYIKENPDADIVPCKYGIQGNLCRIRNHIIREEFKNGNDAVVIVDDDMKALYLWKLDESEKYTKKVKIPTDILIPFFEKYSQICKDLGFFYWGGELQHG